MSKPAFKDLFSKQSDFYKSARPTYPEELFSYLSSLCTEHDCAWDCATGNGQAAVSLKPFFKNVIATDASESQVKNAVQSKGIEYRVGAAENSGIPSHSINLITVATAIHWFNLEQFYTEVKRVLKPDGVFACWTYGWSNFSPVLDAIMLRLGDDILKDYWPEGRKLVTGKYANLYFPFDQIKTPAFHTTMHWNLEQYKMNLRSWSATQQYIEKHNKNPIDLVAGELEKAWGNKETVREGTWQLYIKATKV